MRPRHASRQNPSHVTISVKDILHTVFSTQGRAPFFHDLRLREETHNYLGGILNRIDCPPIIIGGTEDHVHILSCLARSIAPAKMVLELKRASSLWLKTKGPEMQTFAWQKGYGTFSIAHSQIGAAKTYIRNQAEHHRKTLFQDEFRKLLKRYEIAYDERYLWD